ncbi:MAG TPA: 2OG-Fe(II) oxygenase [Candidatus Nanoperiomorbaceae bacterium]|nr:2OG-Fe(II) oxygenase [Candidatus Nanoperiomorbaceae bacterium]
MPRASEILTVIEEASFALWQPVFPAACADSMLLELERAASWRPEMGGFYELDALAGVDSFITRYSSEFAAAAEEAHHRACQWLKVGLTREAGVRVHRFRSGTGAALHSDSAEAGVRLVIFLSQCESNFGGALIFADPQTCEGRVVQAKHNLGVLFPTNSQLQHGVTEQRHGMRYSIVFGFRFT